MKAQLRDAAEFLGQLPEEIVAERDLQREESIRDHVLKAIWESGSARHAEAWNRTAAYLEDGSEGRAFILRIETYHPTNHRALP